MPTFTHLPYAATGHFSPLVTHYLANDPALNSFYKYRPDEAGITAAISDRKNFPVNRQTLVSILQQQYKELPEIDLVTKHIALLQADNTFTICTAHQPNLGTGYLYFVYKILHAIKLAKELEQVHPDKHFVPVYYMGSEDNDLDELGTFRYGGKKYNWDANGQTGAVGRMKTGSLKPLLEELFRVLGPPGPNLETLKELLTTAYLQHTTIGDATQYLVHQLFGPYGLVVLNPDEAAFKQAFIPVMEQDLLQDAANNIVLKTIESLEKTGHKAQAHPRSINLFYLKDDLRERIERHGDEWQVVNTAIRWQKADLLLELRQYPERFSPNVILRGLFQETILPNIVFIGGGAEVAYWLELYGLFQKMNVFYPVIALRQSVMWLTAKEAALRKKLDLDTTAIFASEADLMRRFVKEHSTLDWTTGNESAAIEQHLQQLKLKAQAIDPTLKASTEAVLTKIKYQLKVLERKMLRAEKKKMHTQLQQVNRLKEALFPNGGLQERIDNFMPYYLQYGSRFFDLLLQGMEAIPTQFMIVEEE